MRIIQLTAENVKRLKVVDITPDANMQVVSGRNAQGKTSVLDAIWLALGGGAASRATAKPVRDGEDEARVRLDLGDMVVTRKWAGTKTSLLVEGKDGSAYSRPQELLDGLVGRLSFDPLSFVHQDDRSQLATLQELVDLPFDPLQMAAARDTLYSRRHLIGQDVTRLKGTYESMPMPDPDLPEREESIAALTEEYASASRDVSAREHLATMLAGLRDTVARLERELLEAQENVKNREAELAAMPRARDLAPIVERMNAAEDRNAAIRAAAEYRRVRGQYSEQKAAYDALTDEIEALDARKAAGLAAAHFPVDGLSFGEDGVLYGGIPFRQCSGAEQLRVSLAMAMAMNPELRVIRITDGSLLDSDNMELISQMAREHDFQVWVERVEDNTRPGVIIEDGKVKA